MCIRIVRVCLIFALGLFPFVVHAQALSSKGSEWLAAALDGGKGPQRALVVFRDSSSSPLADIERLPLGGTERETKLSALPAIYANIKARARLADLTGVSLIEDYSNLPMAVYLVRDRAALTAMLRETLVESIQPLEKRQPNAGQNLALIGQPTAALLHQVGSSTAVAVLDTGTDYTRSEFGSCTSPGQPQTCKVVYYAHIAPDDGQLDAIGHGTNVAAIVMAVAPDTRIVSLNVFNGPTADDQDVIRAISWVFANYSQYHIVSANMSLGSNRSGSPCQSQYFVPFQHLLAARVIPVASSGNDADSAAINTPACTPGAVSVGAVYDTNSGSKTWTPCSDATTKSDQIACFSNSAQFLSMLAPGVDIEAGGHNMSGTSQAAPHVSGAVALVRSAAPAASVSQVVSALQSSEARIRDSRNGVVTPRLDIPQALSPFIPGGVDFDQVSYSASGNQNSVTIRLLRKFGHVGDISIRYQTSDGSAKQNVDYTSTNGSLHWKDGDTGPKTFDVPLLRNSALTCGTIFSVQIFADNAASVVLRPYATVSLSDPNTQSEMQLIQRLPDVHHGAPSVNAVTIAASPAFLFTAGGHRISSFSIDPSTGRLSNGAYVDVPVFNTPLSKLLIARGSTLYVDGGGAMPLVADIQSGGNLSIHPRLNPPFGVGYSSIAADPSGRYLYAQTSDGKLATFDISAGDPHFLRFDEYSSSGNNVYKVIMDLTVSSDGATLVANAEMGNEFVLITFARDLNTGALTKIDEFHFPDGLGNEAGGFVGYDNGAFWYHRRANQLYTLNLSDHRFSIIEVQTIGTVTGGKQSITVARDLERVVVSDAQGFISFRIDRNTGKLTRVLGEFNITKCLVGMPTVGPIAIQFYPMRAAFLEFLFGSWKNPDFVDGEEIGVFNFPVGP